MNRRRLSRHRLYLRWTVIQGIWVWLSNRIQKAAWPSKREMEGARTAWGLVSLHVPLMDNLVFAQIVHWSKNQTVIARPCVRRCVIVHMTLIGMPCHRPLYGDVLNHVVDVAKSVVVVYSWIVCFSSWAIIEVLHFNIHFYVAFVTWGLVIVVAAFTVMAL